MTYLDMIRAKVAPLLMKPSIEVLEIAQQLREISDDIRYEVECRDLRSAISRKTLRGQSCKRETDRLAMFSRMLKNRGIDPETGEISPTCWNVVYEDETE